MGDVRMEGVGKITRAGVNWSQVPWCYNLYKTVGWQEQDVLEGSASHLYFNLYNNYRLV